MRTTSPPRREESATNPPISATSASAETPTRRLALVRQHLIDPEICIRCNTCEEVCPSRAISHDHSQYAITFDLCDECGDCIPPCPTGAIDSYRDVEQPHSVEEQLRWTALPTSTDPNATMVPRAAAIPADVARIVEEATRTAGIVPPPWSAAHPYVGLFSLQRPAMAMVTGNYRLTSDDCETDIHHIVLDLGHAAFPVLEGQSVGIVPPGLDATGRPHHVRLYSVASPRDGERPRHNNIALTVKRVTRDRAGAPTRGIASNWLCDLKKGAEVPVTGPYGASLLMPNHPGSNLLMICTGTGAAPMRAMTERRRRRMDRGEGGRNLLFFGARRKDELPYFGPLLKLPKELIDVELAFSRSPESPRQYVQDRMRARHEDVLWFLKDPNSYVYICGLKKMEEGVIGAFSEIAEAGGLAWRDLFARLRAEGRFHLETY